MEKDLNPAGERKLKCDDVSKCFQLLESILDGQVNSDSQDTLDYKLAKCQPCFEYYHLEQAIREVLQTKCTKQPVPSELASSIRQKIEEIK
jgi:anti-sigma factor (TIGR02949 family)